MSKRVLSRIGYASRNRDEAFLALFALAAKADDDGLFASAQWNADERMQSILQSLEDAGAIVRTGRVLVWITAAFSPRELQEIAMRRFRMSPAVAALFVLAILERQHSQKRNHFRPISILAKGGKS